MDDRLELLTQSIQTQLPDGFKSAYHEHSYGGVDFLVFRGREAVSKSSYDLDQLQDYTDNEVVQFVLRDFRGRGVEH